MTHHNDEQFEQRIADQRLRQPSADLDLRVLSTIRANTPATKSRSYRLHAWWLTLGAAAAAAIALAALPNIGGSGSPKTTPNSQIVSTSADIPADDPATTTNEPDFNPVEYRQVVTRLDPMELLILDDQTPVRPVVAERVERFQWVDSANNIEIELEVPQRNVLLLSAPAD